jgi:hypothetical protein
MITAARPLPAFTKAETERFWSKVEIGDADACWNWTASAVKGGYGQFKIRGRSVRAHRVAFWIGHGISTDSRLVCHSCDRPSCCNPAHLFLGTPHDNILDCKAKGRLNTAAGELHGSSTKPESRARGERVAGAVLTANAVVDIRALYASGDFTQQQIADRFGVTREAIGRVTRGSNWKHVGAGDVDQMRDVATENRVKRGTANVHAILSEDDVRAIRTRHSSGSASYRVLAAEYGVSKPTIAAIVHRRTWSHVI